MDALSLLRREVIAGRPVKKQGDLLLLGNDHATPCTVETQFKQHTGGYYTIEAIWFLVQRAQSESHGKYILEAKKNNVPAVTRADRNDVLSYMRGEVSESEKIDKNAFTPSVPSRQEAEEAARKRDADARDSEEAAARKRVREEHEALQVLQKTPARESEGAAAVITEAERDATTRRIMLDEVVYDSRNSILRSKRPFDVVVSYVEAARKKSGSSKTEESGTGSAPKQRRNAPAYDRYDQPAAKAQGAEFGIDETGAIKQRKKEVSAVSRIISPPKPKLKTNRTPIIIVPSGMKDSITLYNVRQYLEEGTFVETQQAMKDFPEGKPPYVVVNRKRGNTTTMYKVVDATMQMTPAHWDRVIACFVAGPDWQFRRWPLFEEGGSAGLFSAVRGFYVYYDDQKPHQNVSKWDITRLQISREKRHLDKTSSIKFWDALDSHARKINSGLRL
eukprot:m.156625 g.156625  ORF g.156625 m.156625 type:complete len:447 (+) comp17942_c0_seq4:30-1370(+)